MQWNWRPKLSAVSGWGKVQEIAQASSQLATDATELVATARKMYPITD